MQRYIRGWIDRPNLETRLILIALHMRPSMLGHEFDRRSVPDERNGVRRPLSEEGGMREPYAVERCIDHVRAPTGCASRNRRLECDPLRSSSRFHTLLLSRQDAPRRRCGDPDHAPTLMRITFQCKKICWF